MKTVLTNLETQKVKNIICGLDNLVNDIKIRTNEKEYNSVQNKIIGTILDLQVIRSEFGSES